MKQFKIFSLLLAIILLSNACSKDNAVSAYIFEDNILHFDGDNVTGPLLPAGTFETAIYFNSTISQEFSGKTIEDVRFFLGPLPQSLELRIYSDGETPDPNKILYQTNLTSAINSFAWNIHTLPQPINITGDGIWVSVRFVHADAQLSIGCDAGPNRDGGDWLFRSSDNNWVPYITRVGESINWNIRVRLSE